MKNSFQEIPVFLIWIFINNICKGGVFTQYKNKITITIWHLVTLKTVMPQLTSGK